MQLSRNIRIVLVISLIFVLGSLDKRIRAGLAASDAVHAQETSPAPRPPLKRQSPSPAPDDEEQDRPIGQTAISVSVDLVSLQVLVTDKKGNVIAGLRPENFTIYEDDVKQEISNFSSVEANVTVVLLVEYSRQVSYFVNEVWNAMYLFADSLRPGDWVAVIGYDIRPTIISDFTQNKDELYNALRRFTYPAFDDSNLSDALIDAIDRTEDLEGKVAILLISTGLDTFSRHTYDEALERCKESNASVFAIGLGQNFRLRAEAAGLISSINNLELLMADNRLRSFAEFTGGAAYFPRFETELPSILSNISMLLRSQYSIAYASTNTKKDGKYRKIKVEVHTKLTDDKGKPLKLKVVTRKGYVPRQD
jgi:VWFA-related protein